MPKTGVRPQAKKMAKMQGTARLPTQNQLATLNQLRHRKKQILLASLSNKKYFDLQKERLDKEEEIVAQGIASLEEEFRLAVKEAKEEGEEVEHGSIIHELLTRKEEDVEEEEEEDVDEDLEAGASDVKKEEESAEEKSAEAEEESEETAEGYARKWWEQNGDDSGIPKKYTPCLYFFKARHGCQKDEACQFSHNGKIFDVEPFHAMVQDRSREKKERKYAGGKQQTC